MGKKIVKKERVSPIYENAIDSLRIGMEFFLKEEGYSSRKHAILARIQSRRVSKRISNLANSQAASLLA